MPRVHHSVLVDASVAEVWAVVRDFGKLADWWRRDPPMEVELEPGKTATEVGVVRNIAIGERRVAERLTGLSDPEMWLSYERSDLPPDSEVQGYHAVMRVRPVTETNQTLFEWTGSFECDFEKAPHWIANYENVYADGSASLQRRFAPT
jgi:hypothetical protein